MNSQQIAEIYSGFVSGKYSYREITEWFIPQSMFRKLYKKIVQIEPCISKRHAEALYIRLASNGCVVDDDDNYYHGCNCGQTEKHLKWVKLHRPKRKKIHPPEFAKLLTPEISDLIISDLSARDIGNLSLSCKWICAYFANYCKCEKCGLWGTLGGKFKFSDVCDNCMRKSYWDSLYDYMFYSDSSGYLIPDGEPDYDYEPPEDDGFSSGPVSPVVQRRGAILTRSSSDSSSLSP